MGPGASSSSNVDPFAVQNFTPEQVASAEVRNKQPYTPCADINASLRTVLIYRWMFSNRRSYSDLVQYARDGCTRWYPGKGFVHDW
eukprot:803300-Heterocapsa_arctica.AAC.1